MFRCGVCNLKVVAGIRPRKLILEKRAVSYPERYATERGENGKSFSRCLDRGGSGIETVREVNACPSCAGDIPTKIGKHARIGRDVTTGRPKVIGDKSKAA